MSASLIDRLPAHAAPIDGGRQPAALRQVYLTPGTLFCGAAPALVRTVLGSCVALCLIDRYNRGAGMNHFVLPASETGEISLRYGDVANDRLRERMIALGCASGDLRAKLFGGAAVLPVGDGRETVGDRNVRVALQWLRRQSVPVIARRTGGQRGLLIRFHTDSGRVMVRDIVSSLYPDPAMVLDL